MHRAMRLLLVLLSSTTLLHAQTASSPERGPDAVTRSITPGIEVLPYPNLPFSGMDTITQTRLTQDGGSVVTSLTAQVARDSQGRVYRERHSFAPQGTDPQKTLHEFYILDPTTGTRTECTLATHHCIVTGYRPQFSVRLMPAGPFDQGRQLLVRDSLGQQSIGDLTTIGTRETITVSAGTLGNDRPLNLAVTRSDPSLGTFDIHLNVQSRTDPSPDLFTIPADYTIQDTRPATQPASANSQPVH